MSIALIALTACPLTLFGLQPTGLAEQLQGAWRAIGGERIIRFDETTCVSFYPMQQSLFRAEYGEHQVQLTNLRYGIARPQKLILDGEVLTFVGGSDEQVHFKRLAVIPDEVRVDALVLGTRSPGLAERDSIALELAERARRDQAVRNRLQSLQTEAAQTGLQPAAGAMARASMTLAEVDAANTRYLVGLLTDVGWIGSERFGEDATWDAYLIVRHSGYLRMVRAVLPSIEAEVQGHDEQARLYAPLYDRTQIALGGNQRYGSQLVPGPDGTLLVDRLEDPENVDARRAAFGMMPLDEYLSYFRRDGREVAVAGLSPKAKATFSESE